VTAKRQLPREELIGFLAEMLLIRRFEEKVTERFRAGELAGFLHACIGQEAVAVGGDGATNTGAFHESLNWHRPRSAGRAQVRLRGGPMSWTRLVS
jgi:TPP-dependent pyruvate/acetoin dehydrogenase alpha subunit